MRPVGKKKKLKKWAKAYMEEFFTSFSVDESQGILWKAIKAMCVGDKSVLSKNEAQLVLTYYEYLSKYLTAGGILFGDYLNDTKE